MSKKSRLILALPLCAVLSSPVAVMAEDAVTATGNTTPGVSVTESDKDGLYDLSFTYVDTDAKDAVKVTVTGSMQWYDANDPVVKAFPKTGLGAGAVVKSASEYKPGMINTGYGLNEDAAVYELNEIADETFTTSMTVPGNLYYYDYTVTYSDGSTQTMQDPTNRSEMNGYSGHDSGHSLVYVGDAAHTTKGQEYIYPTAANKGTHVFVNYEAVDGTSQPLGVYFPPNFDTDKLYPTLYVSHGGGGNEAEWMGIGAAPNIMDNLLAENLAVPAVVVTMDNTYFKWDYDQIAKNFKENIIPFIEANYPVMKDRDSRALCGLSMGSMTTSTLLQKYPELFKYYGCFSGSNAVAPISNLDLVKSANIYLTAGNLDMALMNDSYKTDEDRTTTGLVDKFNELGVKFGYDTKPGAHDWGVWRDTLTTFIKDYAFKDLKTNPEPSPAPLPPVVSGWTRNGNGSWSLMGSDGKNLVGWQKVDGKWYYLKEDGIMAASTWIKSGDNWYYVDHSGAMKSSGWLNKDGAWYYLNADGTMAKDTTVDGYQVGSNGAWIQ